MKDSPVIHGEQAAAAIKYSKNTLTVALFDITGIKQFRLLIGTYGPELKDEILR